MNASRTSQQRRRGKFVMLDYKTLKSKYGSVLAKQIRDEKVQLEASKPASETTVFHMKHPDLPNSEEPLDNL